MKHSVLLSFYTLCTYVVIASEKFVFATIKNLLYLYIFTVFWPGYFYALSS